MHDPCMINQPWISNSVLDIIPHDHDNVLGKQNTNDRIIQQRNQKKKKDEEESGVPGCTIQRALGVQNNHDGPSNPYDDPRVYIEIFSSMKYIYKARCSIQRSDDSRRVRSNKAWLTHMPEL